MRRFVIIGAALMLAACSGSSGNSSTGTSSTNGASSGTSGTSGTTGHGNESCADIEGSWKVTDLTCNGVDEGWPTSQVWTGDIWADGGGDFHQTLGSCSLIESGPWTCTGLGDGGFLLEVDRSNPTQCVGTCTITFPDAGQAADAGRACNQPEAPLYFSVSAISSDNFVITSMDSPSGQPVPLTTCTGLNAQNPISVTWTRQSGGGSTGGTTGGGCSITVTGAASESLTCTQMAGAFDSSNGKGTLGLQSNETVGGSPKFTLAVSTASDLSETTYTYSNSSDAVANYFVNPSTGELYQASESNSAGSVSVNVSSLTVTSSQGSSKTYVAHGSADATLPAAGTATGSVNVHVDF